MTAGRLLSSFNDLWNWVILEWQERVKPECRYSWSKASRAHWGAHRTEHPNSPSCLTPAGLQLQPSTKPGRSCFEAQDEFLIYSWRQQTHNGQQNTQLWELHLWWLVLIQRGSTADAPEELFSSSLSVTSLNKERFSGLWHFQRSKLEQLGLWLFSLAEEHQ